MERTGKIEDMAAVIAIKHAAAAQYSGIGMSMTVDEAAAQNQWSAAVTRSQAHVWEVDGAVAGYLVTLDTDDAVHVDQVSVDPRFAGNRIGAKLIDVAEQQALQQGRTKVTLTTFEDVPWNAPYYRRLGFEVVPEQDWAPGLAELMRAEAVSSGSGRRRVAMACPVGGSESLP